jgi:hypothetical protein
MDAPAQRTDGAGALMAAFLKGNLPGPSAPSPLPSGPLMSLRAYASLTAAPRKAQPRGTRVTVRSFDIFSNMLEEATGHELPEPIKKILPDHMYTEYDDGREQYIFRGGEKDFRLEAQVDPARQSPDYGRGERLLHETYLPGVAARDAKRPSERSAAWINRSGTLYGYPIANSNMAVGDQTEVQFGKRVGDDQTWGWKDGPRFAPWPWIDHLRDSLAQAPRNTR